MSRTEQTAPEQSSAAGRLRALFPLLLALAAVALALLPTAPANADSSFGEEENPQAGHLSVPEGIGVDAASGDLYVADAGSHRVGKFDADGTSLFAFGWGLANGTEAQQSCTGTCARSPFTHNSVKGALLANPQGVAVDPVSHDVYVTDTNYHRIEKFDPNGNFLFSFGGDVVASGPDNSSNDETQKLVISATGGTFQLAFEYPYAAAYEESTIRPQTASLPDDATAAELKAALEALSTINGSFVTGGEVAVAALGGSEYEITFQGSLGGDDVPQLEALPEGLTGGAHTVTVHTLHQGGGAEVCDTAAGDVCKAGGDFASGANGTFAEWPEGADLIGVGPTGTVYVGDRDRVQEFDSAGVYSGQVSLPGAGPTEALAVDGSGNAYVISEEVPGVQKYDPSGALLEALDEGGAPEVLAVDSDGNLFVGEATGSEYQFLEYTSDGTPFASFTSSQVKPREGLPPIQGIAVDAAAGSLYASNNYEVRTSNGPESGSRVLIVGLPHAGPPLIRSGSERATDLEPETATLNALVNPEGNPTEYHFEYVDAASFAAEGGFSGPHTHSTPLASLPLFIHDDPVAAPISSGLAPSTTYHFRVVATSHCNPAEPAEVCEVPGEDATFETLPPVSVPHFTTQTVGPELVTLKAELSPNNGTGTKYEICIGEEEGSYPRCAAGSVNALGNEFESISATFEGLRPDTGYHYQLTATNSYGVEVKTADQAFTTEETLAEENARAGCPNTILREESSSLALPDCRAYERVSPADKGGYAVEPGTGNSLAADGENAFFQSGGIFAGAGSSFAVNPYLARRTPGGWITAPAVGPAAADLQPRALTGLDAGLEHSVFSADPVTSQDEAVFGSHAGAVYYLGSPDASFLPASPPLSENELIAASADFSHLYIRTGVRLLPSDPRPELVGGDRIYQVTGAGGPDPALSLFAEVPVGLNAGSCGIDSGFIATGVSVSVPVSADGSTVVYDAPLKLSSGSPCSLEPTGAGGGPNKQAIFARIAESPAIQISKKFSSRCHSPSPCATAPPANAIFADLSPDGSHIWFTTPQPLVDSDADSGNDLYLATLDNGEVTDLIQASRGDATTDPSPGRGAGVEDVLGVSADGDRAYFGATGVLTTAPNSTGDSAIQGADNLYIYDAQADETRFVARLCSGPGVSGEVADPECPVSLNEDGSTAGFYDRFLWRTGQGATAPGRRFHLTPDGRYLVFDSFGRLTPDDADASADVYRYGLRTGAIQRLSFGRRGNDADGNDDAFPAFVARQGNYARLDEAAQDGERSISADGSVVVFETAAPLVSRDTDQASDVYQWQEDSHGTCRESGGCISLLSDGLSPQGASHGVVSASGRDVTFITPRSLVPGDTDGQADVYDAREDGGFPYSVPPAPCGGAEACHLAGPPAPAPPKIITENPGPGNGARRLKCAKGRVRVKKHGQVRCGAKKHHKAEHHHRPKKNHKRAGSKHGGGK